MRNPLFYERQRMRASTWNVPRFLHSFDETIDGGLILPRGLIDTVSGADRGGRQQAGSQRRAVGRDRAGIHFQRHVDQRPARRPPTS